MPEKSKGGGGALKMKLKYHKRDTILKQREARNNTEKKHKMKNKDDMNTQKPFKTKSIRRKID